MCSATDSYRDDLHAENIDLLKPPTVWYGKVGGLTMLTCCVGLTVKHDVGNDQSLSCIALMSYL